MIATQPVHWRPGGCLAKAVFLVCFTFVVQTILALQYNLFIYNAGRWPVVAKISEDKLLYLLIILGFYHSFMC
jgi:hypothetical protein